MMSALLRLTFVLVMNFFCFSAYVVAATKAEDKILNNRVKIGPTINSPIEYKGKLYFLSTTGVLYESNYDLSDIKNIYQTALTSFCALTLHNGVLYFGEGLHTNTKTNFYAFDLKTKKQVFKIAVDGHIERPPVINNNIAYVGLGPSGIGALDLKTQKFIWQTKVIKSGNLHVDSTPVISNQQLCTVSIYDFKGIFCLNLKDGRETYHLASSLSPKSEIGVNGDVLFGYTTEANMNDLKGDTPSNFFIWNLKDKKLIKEVKLRGYNFFAPLVISSNEVFVTLSTGDLITINLDTGALTYVGEFPEPFISNAFKIDGALCAIGVMGQQLCYKPVKGGYALTVEKRHSESTVGQIKNMINGKYYIPSRIGYFTL